MVIPDTPQSTDELRIEDNPKWIRGLVDGSTVVDSRSTKLVWEVPWYPAWYIPTSDVLDSSLPRVTRPELADHVRVDWQSVDRWYEESIEVFVHPRSPYTRIDAMASSRHVVVRIDDTIVAETDRVTILYETGLPPRWYIPALDVRLEMLTATDTTSGCPYKGFARYWAVDVNEVTHADVVWSYPTPLPESEAIAGMMCFYDEKVDLEIDGERRPRPVTKFS